MTSPRSSGSRPVAPLPPVGQPHVSPLPSGINPAPLGTEAPPAAALPAHPGPAATSPGDPGFIGATSRERVPTHRRRNGVAPLGWLPWAALAALIALLALVTLVATRVGRDSSSESSSAGSSAAGRLTAGTTDVLGSRTALAHLGDLAGRPATGNGVRVQSVVANEGFWVGPSATDRVFVYLTPKARTTEGESPFQVRAGQRIDLSGTVTRLGGSPSALGVTDAEGARQLAAQRGYVSARTVHLSR